MWRWVILNSVVVGCIQGNRKKHAGSEDEYDVVIVGGGMVGAAVGCGIGMYLVAIFCVLAVVQISTRSFRSIFLGFQRGISVPCPVYPVLGGMTFVQPYTCLFSDFVTGSSPLTRDLRVAIVDSAKSMASPKHDTKAVPDQRVSAITPATVRFLKGFLSFS